MNQLMMMKRVILSLIVLLGCLSVQAGEVTPEEALQKAQQVLQGRNLRLSTKRFVPRNAQQASQPFYVFNAEGQQGFVIVSADDRTVAILGYSHSGNLDTDNLPDNLREWLEGYAHELEWLQAQENYQPATQQVQHPSDVVSPLLTCQWSQSEPYNLMCPMDGDRLSATGCVATAMAQVMYYHRWPQDPTASIPSYTTQTREIFMPELPPTTFNWSEMKDTYNKEDTGAAADAVAELMLYCGQSVEMNYTADGSSASSSNIVKALTDYFGYSRTSRQVKRNYYSTTEWESMMVKELQEGRPVLYDGRGSGGGHQFVIDGYDGSGMFHVNWGWGGNRDEYYVLSVLNPYNNRDGYSSDQSAIIGVKPDDGENNQDLYLLNWGFGETNYIRSSTDEDFSVHILCYFKNNENVEVTCSHGWALYKDGVIIQGPFNTTSTTVEPHNTVGESYNISFGAGMADGEYELYPVYYDIVADEWVKMTPYYSLYITIATIDGNNLTLNEIDLLGDKNYLINSVTYDDNTPRQGRTMLLHVNLTNMGYSHEQRLYFFEGSDQMAQFSIYLEHGETGDIDISYTPQSSGQVELKLSSDSKGSNLLWSNNIDITPSYKQSLEGSIENDANVGNTLKATITLRNVGNNTYNDDIRVYLVPYDENSHIIKEEQQEQVFYKEIAVNGTTTFDVEWTGLRTGIWYSEGVCYYSLEDDRDYKELWATSRWIKLYESTGISLTPATSPTDDGSEYWYTLDGRQVKNPGKGVYIVKLSDGTVKRVVVK